MMVVMNCEEIYRTYYVPFQNISECIDK